MRLAALLRDPLLLFLIIGGACYGLWALRSPDDSEVIIVDASIRAQLAEDHLDLTGRAPNDNELDALVERWIRDEILFREALARGLHLGDGRMRHRLIDKMRFLLVEAPSEPTAEALLDYYLEHIVRYRTEWRISFDARFFANPDAVPDDLLARLAAGEAVDSDEYWLGDRFEDYHLSMVRSIFGGRGARQLMVSEVCTWIGPLPSPRGVHFASVTARTAPTPIPFDVARERVAEDWRTDTRDRALEAAVAELAPAYAVDRND